MNFFKVIGEIKHGIFEPEIFWIRTTDESCYRFFIDACTFHWMECSWDEMREAIDEDFEPRESSKLIDLKTTHNLEGDMIHEIAFDHFTQSGNLVAKLVLLIGNCEIELLDFNDREDQILNIIGYDQ